MFSRNVHPDLTKLQAEYGANHSYRDATICLKKTLGEDRKIHNRTRIQRVTKEIGTMLEETQKQNQGDETQLKENKKEPAKELCAVADGGYVHNAENKGKNFEVMVGKVYCPENVVRIDRYHTIIKEKHCASSAKSDKQATMKNALIMAAKKEGLDKNVTSVTALADGANNCWKILESLAPHCCKISYILDWFHIGKYIKRIKLSVPSMNEEFEKIRKLLWNGNVTNSLSILADFLKKEICENNRRLIYNFHDYISNNKNRIVDYGERKKLSLIYSSHVAESTVGIY